MPMLHAARRPTRSGSCGIGAGNSCGSSSLGDRLLLSSGTMAAPEDRIASSGTGSGAGSAAGAKCGSSVSAAPDSVDPRVRSEMGLRSHASPHAHGRLTSVTDRPPDPLRWNPGTAHERTATPNVMDLGSGEFVLPRGSRNAAVADHHPTPASEAALRQKISRLTPTGSGLR